MDKRSVNKARSLYYGFMSKFFVFTSREDRFDGILEALEVMMQNPLDENSLEALKEIKEFIDAGGYTLLAQEYDDIFHNPEKKVVRNTASYYDEGVESGNKRVAVKNFLGKTRIRRNEKEFKENEDSVGFLVTFMHEIIELVMAGDASYDTLQHCLFVEIINEFFDDFVANIYEHPKANAYKSLAVVLNAFLEFERLYFDVAKPALKEKVTLKAVTHKGISTAEAKRRAENKAKKAQGSKK
ncbi:MAG: molecular chaperone TorD family protein [Sulfurospirillum sp.]|nr:molecular chaperone TorD family protein [Sulfurospirillum sp.]